MKKVVGLAHHHYLCLNLLLLTQVVLSILPCQLRLLFSIIPIPIFLHLCNLILTPRAKIFWRGSVGSLDRAPHNMFLRQSTRVKRSLTWLQDYVSCTEMSSFVSPSRPSVSPLSLSTKFQAHFSTVHEPITYHHAKTSHEWSHAMDLELTVLQKPIGFCWVYKLKLNPNGTINKYKAG